MTKPYLVHSSDLFEVLSAFYPESFVAVSIIYRLFGSFEKKLEDEKTKAFRKLKVSAKFGIYTDPNKASYTVMAV